MAAAALLALLPSAYAAQVPFTNCLDTAIQNPQSGGQRLLQFVPMFLDARFNTTDRRHGLNITVYGNVTGQSLPDPLPDWSNNTYWNSPNSTEGKVRHPLTAIRSLATTTILTLAAACKCVHGD